MTSGPSPKLSDNPIGSLWLESEEGKGSTFHFTAGFKPHTQQKD